MAEPVYLHEYVSAVVPMGPIFTGTEWELDITLANRGGAVEYFQGQILGGGPNFEVINLGGGAIEPSRTGGWGFVSEVDPGIEGWDIWWFRISVTSLNLVPTMRFHIEGTPPSPPVPEFFFGPGDFAVFPLRLTAQPPRPGNPVIEG
jgi:hypothetical protein